MHWALRVGVIVACGIVLGFGAHVLLSASGSGAPAAAELEQTGSAGKHGSGPGSPSDRSGGDGPTTTRLTISVSGDILIHSPIWQRALANGGDGATYDFAPMFSALKGAVKEADLAVCHLETPVTSAAPSGYPIFSAPLDLIKGIRQAGWDACDTASNHSLDQGQQGIDETVAALRRAGISQTGSFVSAGHARRPVLLDVGGVKIGFLAYTDATNGIPPPSPWSVALLPAAESARGKAARVKRDVARAVAAGADAVLVSIQWGDENSTSPNESQLALARKVAAIPEVLAIAGQGPHVVQPIRRIRGKFVIFSSGNLLSNQSALAGLPTETQYGLVALFRVVVREPVDGEAGKTVRVLRVDYVPTWVRLTDYLVVPVGWGLRNDPANANALRAAWEKTVAIAGRGARIAPLPRRLP